MSGTAIFTYLNANWTEGDALPLVTNNEFLYTIPTVANENVVVGATYTVVYIDYTYTGNSANEGFLIGANGSNQPTDITQFGGIPLTTGGSQFLNYAGTWGANPAAVFATFGIPTIQTGTSFANVFYGCSNLHLNSGSSINNWNIINVNNLSGAFFNTRYDSPLNNWDVVNVTTMENMFNQSRFNQSLNNWITSSLTITSSMFNKSWFNGLIGNFDMAKVTNASSMFYRAESFNQDISEWDLSSMNKMGYMFYRAKVFNQDVSNWDVSNVDDMNFLFYRCNNFNQDLSNWKLDTLANKAANMFDQTALSNRNYNALLTGWAAYSNTPNGVNIGTIPASYDPIGARGRAILLGKGWSFSDTSTSVITGSMIFSFPTTEWTNAGKPYPLITTDNKLSYTTTDVVIGNYTISTVNYSYDDDTSPPNDGLSFVGFDPTLLANTSTDITQFDNIPLSRNNSHFKDYKGTIGANPESVAQPYGLGVPFPIGTTLNSSFMNATNANGDISSWDVTTITDMTNLFNNAVTFNQDISNWDVSVVTNCSGMFRDALLFNQDIGSWNVSNVTDFSNMLNNAEVFNQNIGSWDLSSATTMANMLDDCGMNLTILEGNNNFDNLLNGWYANVNTPNSITLGAENQIYTSLGETSYDELNSSKSWTISGGTEACFHQTTTILCLKDGIDVYMPVTELKLGDLVKTYKDGYVPITNLKVMKCINHVSKLNYRFFVMEKNKNPLLTHDLVVTGGHSMLVDEDCISDENKAFMIGCGMKFHMVHDKYKELVRLNPNFVGKIDNSVEKVYLVVLEHEDINYVYGMYVNGGVLVESTGAISCK